MMKEFREFALRGNVVDMAVGIIIGVAFGAVIKSLVDNVLMPPIGLLLGNVDFTNLLVVLKAGVSAGPYATLAEAQEAGAVAISYGVFVNAIVSFVIVAFAVFMVVRQVNRMRRAEESPAEPTTRECPRCLSSISVKATRCAFCTSDVEAAAG